MWQVDAHSGHPSNTSKPRQQRWSEVCPVGRLLSTCVGISLAVAGLVTVAEFWAAAQYPAAGVVGVVLVSAMTWALNRSGPSIPVLSRAGMPREHLVRLMPDLEVTFRGAHGGNPASWRYDRQLSASDPLFLYVTMQTEQELTKWQLRTGQDPTFADLVDDARADIRARAPATKSPTRTFPGHEAAPVVYLVKEEPGGAPKSGKKPGDGRPRER